MTISVDWPCSRLLGLRSGTWWSRCEAHPHWLAPWQEIQRHWGCRNNMHAISSAFVDVWCVELNNYSRKANCSISWSVTMTNAEILKKFLMFKLLSCILYRPQPVTLQRSARIPVIKITHMVKAHHLGFRSSLLLKGYLEMTFFSTLVFQKLCSGSLSRQWGHFEKSRANCPELTS